MTVLPVWFCWVFQGERGFSRLADHQRWAEDRVNLGEHSGELSRAVAGLLVRVPGKGVAFSRSGVPVAGGHPEHVDDRGADPVLVVGVGGGERGRD